MRTRGFIIVIAIMMFLVMDIIVFAEEDGGYLYYEDDTLSGSDDSGLEDAGMGDFDFDIDPDLSFPVGSVPDISSSSGELGTFGEDDRSVSDMLGDLFDGLKNLGFGLSDDDKEVLQDDLSLTDRDVSFISSDDIPVLVADGLDLYANYNTYYGSIASTYLEYARGYLPKLERSEHYVLARTGQYDYIFVFGENLSSSGYSFSGSNVTVIHWNTYNNGSFSFGTESSFTLSCGSNMVYSDLGRVYPSLADTTAITSRQILYLLCIAGLIFTMSFMYNVRSVRRLKKIENV